MIFDFKITVVNLQIIDDKYMCHPDMRYFADAAETAWRSRTPQ